MSARSRMTHRAAVERATTVEDELGQPGAATWASHIASLACWYYQNTERELGGPVKSAVVEDARLIVPRGTDIRENDRINGITTKRGATLIAGVQVIELVISRRDHIELALRKIA